MTTKRRKNPEALLQIRVRKMLMQRAPDLFWIGGAAGLRLSPMMVNKAKAMGALNRGWPDLTILCPDGIIRTIELKADAKGELSAEQEQFRDVCAWSGRDVWAKCWSLEMVEAKLTDWGVVLKPEADFDAYEDDGLSFGEAFE